MDITFKAHYLGMKPEKMEVMSICEQEIDLRVVVDGKTTKQVNNPVYFGGAVCEGGGCR